MDRQRGRSEPADLSGEKVDTSDLVYSPNVDFGRRNNKPMVRSVREVERQRRKELEDKIKTTEGLSNKEKKDANGFEAKISKRKFEAEVTGAVE